MTKANLIEMDRVTQQMDVSVVRLNGLQHQVDINGPLCAGQLRKDGSNYNAKRAAYCVYDYTEDDNWTTRTHGGPLGYHCSCNTSTLEQLSVPLHKTLPS